MRTLIVLLGLTLAGAAQAEDAVTVGNDALIADPQAVAGKTVTLGPCSLYAGEIEGDLTCRLVNPDGSQAKDSVGLPVDLFLKAAGLGESGKAYIAASCDEFKLCTGTILVTGPASVGILGSVSLATTEIAVTP
ncbi:MAG: hypothetical protein QM702_10785 [Rubrivivax sp.]